MRACEIILKYFGDTRMRERRNINFELEEEEAALLLGLIGDRLLDLQLTADYRILSIGEEEERITLSNLDMELRDLISDLGCRNSFVGFEAAAELLRSRDEIEENDQPNSNSSFAADRRRDELCAHKQNKVTIPAPIANDPVEW